MMKFKNVIDECLETVEKGVIDITNEELEKAYLETKSPFFYERIRSFSDINKVELYIYTIINKKVRYEEATYNKLLKKLKDQLEILKFEQNS